MTRAADRHADPARGPLRLWQGLRRASALKAPISPFVPRELDEAGIEKQIADFATAAARAREAGYDGVEVMGSEGYFINQFLVSLHTNRRTDRWGGATRTGCACRSRWCAGCARRWGRISSSSTASRFSTSCRTGRPGTRSCAGEGRRGGGRHDPQHRHRLARGAGADHRHLGAAPGLRLGDGKLMGEVGIPSSPRTGSTRPRWPRRCWPRAAPTWCRWRGRSWPTRFRGKKAAEGRPREIAPCIACNQACLDHTFQGKISTCLVNPRAAFETELNYLPTEAPKSHRRRGRRPGRADGGAWSPRSAAIA
jgi:2,4-dienoyl-CoA reductase (NADPH2)